MRRRIGKRLEERSKATTIVDTCALQAHTRGWEKKIYELCVFFETQCESLIKDNVMHFENVVRNTLWTKVSYVLRPNDKRQQDSIPIDAIPTSALLSRHMGIPITVHYEMKTDNTNEVRIIMDVPRPSTWSFGQRYGKKQKFFLLFFLLLWCICVLCALCYFGVV